MDGFLRRLGFGLTLLAAAAAGAAAVALLGQDRAAMPAWLSWVAAGLVFLVLITSVFSVRLMARRIDRLRTDLDTLSLSMDQAVRDLAGRAERDAQAFSDQQARMWQAIDGPKGKPPVREEAARAAVPIEREMQADPGNVVPYPHAKLARRPAASRPPVPATGVDIAGLVHQALSAQTVDLSLRPIISMARGAAAGFDVFAYFEVEGEGLVVPANAADVPEAEGIAFESLVLDMAIASARRRQGTVGHAMALHVPVTKAFLLDASAVERLAEAIGTDETLANAIVLSVPARMARRDAPTLAALQKITQSGVRLALEDLPATSDLALPAVPQVAFVKVPARRLLDEPRGERDLPAQALSAGALVIAVDVESDRDAIALIDAGINLMSGSRFSGPRRIRSDDESTIERISRVSVNNS